MKGFWSEGQFYCEPCAEEWDGDGEIQADTAGTAASCDECGRTDKTKTYIVRWEVEVEANSHEEAAEEALAMQRDTSSLATVFDVRDDTPDWRHVDLGFDERLKG